MPTLQEYEKGEQAEAIWVAHPLEGIDFTSDDYGKDDDDDNEG